MDQQKRNLSLSPPVRVEIPTCPVCGGRMLATSTREQSRLRKCESCGNTGIEAVRRR